MTSSCAGLPVVHSSNTSKEYNASGERFTGTWNANTSIRTALAFITRVYSHTQVHTRTSPHYDVMHFSLTAGIVVLLRSRVQMINHHKQIWYWLQSVYAVGLSIIPMKPIYSGVMAVIEMWSRLCRTRLLGDEYCNFNSMPGWVLKWLKWLNYSGSVAIYPVQSFY